VLLFLHLYLLLYLLFACFLLFVWVYHFYGLVIYMILLCLLQRFIGTSQGLYLHNKLSDISLYKK